jgi:hypothetical protein
MNETIQLRLQLDRLHLENQRRSPLESRVDLLARADQAVLDARRLRVVDFEAVGLMRRGELLAVTGQDDEAIRSWEEAHRVLGEHRQSDLGVRVRVLLAAAHARRADWPAVERECSAGIRLVETFRYRVTGPYMQSAYLRSRIDLFQLGVRAALELGDLQLALERAELSKSRMTLLFRGAEPPSTEVPDGSAEEVRRISAQIDELRAGGETIPDSLLARRRAAWDLMAADRFRARGQTVPPFSLAAVQAALECDEAVLYFYWLQPGELLLVTIDSHDATHEILSVTSQHQAELEEFTDVVLNFQPGQSFGYFGRQTARFGHFLPRFTSNGLAGKRRLLISPHRRLHLVPFHALPWQGELLIRRYAVTYVPNLSTLLLRYERRTEKRVLAVGLSEFHVPGAAFAPLPGAEVEVDGLEGLCRGHGMDVTVLRGASASESNVHALEAGGGLRDFSTIHLATHGHNVDSDAPLESFLVMTNSLLDGLEIAGWELDTELLVLSACCSGQRAVSGRGLAELPGDELLGLQAAFFAAGAHKQLSSLWPVSDAVTPEIMKGFYEQFLAGVTAEVALQRAIVQYLDSAGIRRRNPYYWASFFLCAVGRPAAPSPATEA